MAVTITWFFYGYTCFYNTYSNSFRREYKFKNRCNTYARNNNSSPSGIMEIKTTYGSRGKVNFTKLIQSIKNQIKPKQTRKL